MRNQDLWYDVNSETLRNPMTGAVLGASAYPVLHLQEAVLFRVRLVTSSRLRAYTGLPADGSLTAAVTLSWDSAIEPLVRTLSGDINDTDAWSKADVTRGLIGIPLDCDTVNYADAVGGRSHTAAAWFSLAVTNSDDSVFAEYTFPVVCRNLSDASAAGALPPVAGPYPQRYKIQTPSGYVYVVTVADDGEPAISRES